MYYNGTYTIKDVRNYDGGSWQCNLRVTAKDGIELHTTGNGYTVRGAIWKANRAMDKVMKYKRFCDAVQSACQPPEERT